MLGLLATAAIGAAATLVIQALVSWALTLYQSRNGEFAGRWYAINPPIHGGAERRDFIRVRQRGLRLHIVAKRYLPISEQGQVWKMRGYCHGNVLVAVFYTTTPRRDPSSYGVLVLHRDHANKAPNVWRGYYLRPDLASLTNVMQHDIPWFPIVWQQADPDKFGLL